jgi:hypothetical protein
MKERRKEVKAELSGGQMGAEMGNSGGDPAALLLLKSRR